MYVKKKYRRLLDLTDEQFVIPNSFQRFINEKKLLHNLIIKSKGNNLSCTCCGYNFVAQAKVNGETRCPSCKRKLLVKTDRLKYYDFKDHLQLLDKIEEYYVLRTFELRTFYKRGKEKKSYITEFMRTILDGTEIHDFVSNQTCNHMGYMYIAHTLPFTHWRGRNYRWAYRDVIGMVCPYNLKSLLKNTELKYSQLDKFVSKMDYIDFIKYFKNIAYYPSFELLVKLKLYNLAVVADKFNRGKNFQEIFGLPKSSYPFIKKHNLNYDQLEVLRLLQKEDIRLINKLVGYRNLKELSRYVNLEDAYYNILRKNPNSEHEYLDYLRMCIQLDYPMKDKKILFPRNLEQEHDRLVDLIELVKNEANDRLIKQRLEHLNNNIYQNKKFIIFPAPSVDSLINESKQQCNCVKTYCSRYALGEADIYYLRELNNQDKSLVTVEVIGTDIVQAKVKYNDNPSKEQMKFLNKWRTNVLMKAIT